MNAWIQNNWYEFGTLIAEFSFVFAAIWFARKILKTLRASQEQVGALLKLSVSDGLNERSKPNGAPAHSPTPYVAADWPARSLSEELSGRPAASTPIISAPPSAPIMSSPDAPDSTPYVAAPLTLPEEEESGSHLAAAGRGVIRWLNTPMASRSGPSPLRRMVRWLQAPAGHQTH